jgi:osmotically-inducible protein OsmY
MHRRDTILALFLLGGLLASSGCLAQAVARPDDGTITHWIYQALQEDLHVDPSNIKVDTRDGIVTLTGAVRTLAGKQYADLEAQKIAGVRGVINDLRAMPSSLFDADIAQDVRRRLGSSASLTSFTSSGLGVTVHNGEVTLSGRVNSYAESQEASRLASEVRGVSAVIDHLTVTYPKTRPDAEIQQDVETTLSNDVDLIGLPIRVTVTKGWVTLDGTVGSVYQKQRAGTSARLIWNVTGVDNQLMVDPAMDRGTRRQARNLTDARVAAAAHAVFTADQRLLPEEITVTVHQGEVTLLGTVPSNYQQRIAEYDARNVVGVARVVNQLAVRTVPRADAALQDDVQFQLNSDAILGTDTIATRVHSGVVTLSGAVHNNAERDHAAEVASRVIGVRQVVNQTIVNWGYDDVALQRRIERRLIANAETNWVAKAIRVAVDQGKVTLSGRVNLWSERQAAGRVAFRTYGVRSVDNQLGVISPEEGG